jgi:flavin reductase (DIM6/NTAB) family NADH-FMN oxidoreductase RutF
VTEAQPEHAAARPDPASYRQVMGRFATGVTIVSVVDDGVRYGMTVNSLTSVSLDPVLVLFCCEEDASLHAPLLSAGAWAVSILGLEHEQVSRWFATRGTRGVDQFDGYDVDPGPITGAPLLRGALGWLECRTWATYDGGDHTIVVGEVLGVAAGSDTVPLLYHRGAYRTLA